MDSFQPPIGTSEALKCMWLTKVTQVEELQPMKGDQCQSGARTLEFDCGQARDVKHNTFVGCCCLI